MRFLFLLTLLTLPAACGDGVTHPAGDLRVLFIGNSLTSFNDLPGMVEALGRLGGPRLEVGTALIDGTSLEDQYGIGEAHAQLNRGPWDVVVLQQGPSSLSSSAANLLEWTRRWNTDIRAAGAVPALYAVWPDASRRAFFGDVSRHYRAAADAVDGLFLPAGDAWLAAWAEEPDLPLYGSDDFHPSGLGSLLAALTIYGGLTGVVPEVPVPFEGGWIIPELTPEWGLLLTRAARTALDSR